MFPLSKTLSHLSLLSNVWLIVFLSFFLKLIHSIMVGYCILIELPFQRIRAANAPSSPQGAEHLSCVAQGIVQKGYQSSPPAVHRSQDWLLRTCPKQPLGQRLCSSFQGLQGQSNSASSRTISHVSTVRCWTKSHHLQSTTPTHTGMQVLPFSGGHFKLSSNPLRRDTRGAIVQGPSEGPAHVTLTAAPGGCSWHW